MLPQARSGWLFLLLAASACDGSVNSSPLPRDAVVADEPDGAPPPVDAAQDGRPSVAIEVFEPDAARMCVAAIPLDLDPSPGLQPDCWATQRFPTGSNSFHEVTLPDCRRGLLPCWKLVEDGTCAGSGLRLEVDRAAAPQPGSRVAIYCRVS